MKIGFTGSRKGMTWAQTRTLFQYLKEAAELHHGDCVGSDLIAHLMALDLGVAVTLHPPTNPSMRAFCEGWKHSLEPTPYLDRNKMIVDATDFLIATPETKESKQRSGTWSTVRYAEKTGKDCVVIYPNGKKQEFIRD